jgi:RimJ/RimL family protein N-acetyltransferase
VAPGSAFSGNQHYRVPAYRRVCFIAMLDPKSYGGARRDRACCNDKPREVWNRVASRAAWSVSFVGALVACSLRAVEAMPVMMDLANYSATETLRDGRTVEIRAQRSQDRQGMQAAIARSSSGSLHRRFFAVRREFSKKETDYFLDIDFVSHVALVAVANDAGQPTIVGGGRYVVIQPGQAEVAFAIVDAYQGQGIGSALMRHLATLGRAAGLREFIAEVLSENVPMLNVFERSGLAMSTERDGTVIHVTLRFA